ncbi:MAG: hypothetical protein J6W24_03465 [Prevotella sp.]|nr:hypothetical protein [Prevotella sp.]
MEDKATMPERTTMVFLWMPLLGRVRRGRGRGRRITAGQHSIILTLQPGSDIPIEILE